MVPYLQACRGAALDVIRRDRGIRPRSSFASGSASRGESWANMIVSQHDRPTVQLVSVCPAGPGSRNRLDGRPDCPLRIHRVATQRLCGVLDVVLAVVDFGHRVDFRLRRNRGRARRRRGQYRRCRIRVAPPTSLRPNSYRSAALHRAVRRGARRHEGAEPLLAAPGNRLRLSQRAFSGTRAQFRYWADNSSKKRCRNRSSRFK
jgi:hypothetical protein